jgi:DNA (cytosine-5)-methyltransferase 1
MKSVDNTLLNGFSFIDLFAGIGGFHLALSSFGAKCLFASEWDKYAAETYSLNFGIQPFGDITQIHENQIPPHDILCAGFPCQAFSVSGKQRGFEDTRGTLFFEIARIAKYHKPKILFLENVKNLLRHDEGKTLETILSTLNELGYTVFHKVLNAADFGLPQNRERIYIVAFRKDLGVNNFNFPFPVNKAVSLNDILEQNPHEAKIIERDDIDLNSEHQTQNDLFGKKVSLNKPIQIGKVNKGGQGERIYHPEGHAITLSAHGGGVGSKTGLYLIDGKIRKLTPRECARVQGFPDDFLIHPNRSQAYKQFGNSVAINVLQEIVFNFSEVLLNNCRAKIS